MSSPFKTFAFHTLGCKVNFADSSTISRQLVSLGYSQISKDEIADIHIINTCSVTETADKKAKKLIKKINKKSPDSKIIVTGCYAQLEPDELNNLNGVEIVVGAEGKLDIKNYLIDDCSSNEVNVTKIENAKDFQVSYSLSERTRAFIKIQDGCDYNCSYCTIPNARGISRSNSIKSTVAKIKEIIDTGIKEIVLSGINLGDFGISYNENFYTLLQDIEKINNLERYRISSIEPNLLNNDIISLISNSGKCAKHLHIPLQSGSNYILKMMKRRYTSEYYMKLIKHIKSVIPNICIGVDVIVGFPGETDYEFNKTYDFLRNIKPSYLHVFSYSERKNTEAINLGSKVDCNKIKNRRKKLQRLSNLFYKNFIKKNIGITHRVLFENHDNGLINGLSDNYLRIYSKASNNCINRIKKVKITEHNEFIFGKIID